LHRAAEFSFSQEPGRCYAGRAVPDKSNMKNQDIRWIQGFHNFKGAFHQLAKAAKLAQERDLSELEQQGCSAFEFTHELAWNVLKDYLEDRVSPESSAQRMPRARLSRMACWKVAVHGWGC
jgi:hypothetical protein